MRKLLSLVAALSIIIGGAHYASDQIKLSYYDDPGPKTVIRMALDNTPEPKGIVVNNTTTLVTL
ncbi:hypothetical protein CBW65_02050 [Tumebacillus avium]|uniref:Uncharacterized protein n=1 Tax=Tumebacillus avium TaxID=1903704 RepID=A0A1Y0IHQ6_9BACL|nr:hypothetical protein [Tumebacillus avium]ARU59978.1 hypothetical protein CBW65_02050 [Tumebacillus avium]